MIDNHDFSIILASQMQLFCNISGKNILTLNMLKNKKNQGIQ